MACKLILTQKDVNCTQILGATHLKKLICVGQKCLEQKNGNKLLGVKILGVLKWNQGSYVLCKMEAPYTEDVPKPYRFTSIKWENSYVILNSALVFSLPFTTIMHRSA